jgi:nicotinamide-nucleotide amidase
MIVTNQYITVILNKRGTAPGMWFEKQGKVFVSMPGVPHEMKGMMNNYVIPELQNRLKLPPIVHRTLVTAGIGESFLAERISEFESTLPPSITLAYLPNYGMVKLRLSTRGNNPGMVAKLEAEFDMLKQQVADVMIVDEDKSIQQVVADILVKNQQTLSTAESCTGGYIAQLITAMPGSSMFYQGGVVAYSNDLKEKLVGVNHETLEKNGAVSRETVIEMAEGLRTHSNCDFAIATSGIMGPDGGSPEKPVGSVWVGVASGTESEAHQYQFRFDRQRNIELTATYGLNTLRKFMLG